MITYTYKLKPKAKRDGYLGNLIDRHNMLWNKFVWLEEVSRKRRGKHINGTQTHEDGLSGGIPQASAVGGCQADALEKAWKRNGSPAKPTPKHVKVRSFINAVARKRNGEDKTPAAPKTAPKKTENPY